MNWPLREARNRFSEVVEAAIENGPQRAWGEFVGRGYDHGRPPLNVDASIGATALVDRLRLMTRNVRDFDRMGVEIIDPWQ